MFLKLWARQGAKRAPQRPPEVPRASILNNLVRFSNHFWKDVSAVEKLCGRKALGNWIKATPSPAGLSILSLPALTSLDLHSPAANGLDISIPRPQPTCPDLRRPAAGGLTMFWALPGLAPQPLTFIDRPWVSLVPQTPLFYRQEPFSFMDRALASLAPKPSLLLTGTPHFYRRGLASQATNPSLLLARPLSSISQTPHFY